MDRAEETAGQRDERRSRLVATMERERARLVEAAPGSPEWDAARAALDDLEWQLMSMDGPGPDEESI